MRVVLQRVSRACVRVGDEVVGAVDGPGVVALVGVTPGDGAVQVAWMARKIAQLRMMSGETSLLDIGGSVLLVSQFTLYGDVRKGRRPSWSAAAPGPDAEGVVLALAAALAECGLRVAQGRFGAQMSVEILADGPYTLVIDTPS